MQTFMIPDTIFMSLFAGALFGVVRGLFFVVFNATAGASCCYFLSKLISIPIVNWLWPEKHRFFQAEEREIVELHALSVSNTDTAKTVHQFGIANSTVVGLIPASYITIRAGLAVGELKLVKDLYDLKTLVVLFLIGSILLLPTLLKRKRIYD
ncbi:SNARE associated Golgi protein family [Striga asiatica]|uniref:SNARE associated Golgi protein family n=1 Tax=Striga asiatica TaxID=4170 RepID=A0A5A7QH39_STRAF|nr:SNARE associated Golgi protein family [Striga asiatica]